MIKRLIVTCICAALLAACSAAWSGAPAGSGYPAAGDPGYPVPGEEQPAMTDPTSAAPSSGDAAVSLFPPQPGDPSLTQGNFLVNSAVLIPNPRQENAFDLSVDGTLPTPCNKLRVEISPPDAQNHIRVTAYSVANPEEMCVERIEPFEGLVATLGGYPSGVYTVSLNETDAGELTIP